MSAADTPKKSVSSRTLVEDSANAKTLDPGCFTGHQPNTGASYAEMIGQNSGDSFVGGAVNGLFADVDHE